jgi:hypothetical protein
MNRPPLPAMWPIAAREHSLESAMYRKSLRPPCVLALQVAHLMRRECEQAGQHLSVRELLDTLAGIQETVLIYPSTGGRPKARRMLTETTETQDQLTKIFDLAKWAPRS